MFHAGLFQHCTSVPVFVVKDRVYFGKCPYVHVVAWGAGNKLSDAQKEVLEKQRRIEKQRMEREKRQFVRNYRMQRELNNQRNAEPPSQTTQGGNPTADSNSNPPAAAGGTIDPTLFHSIHAALRTNERHTLDVAISEAALVGLSWPPAVQSVRTRLGSAVGYTDQMILARLNVHWFNNQALVAGIRARIARARLSFV